MRVIVRTSGRTAVSTGIVGGIAAGIASIFIGLVRLLLAVLLWLLLLPGALARAARRHVDHKAAAAAALPRSRTSVGVTDTFRAATLGPVWHAVRTDEQTLTRRKRSSVHVWRTVCGRHARTSLRMPLQPFDPADVGRCPTCATRLGVA